MPALSIITINYNDVEGLKKTMNSVFAQTFSQYEYIVIDGGSKDGSKEYIEQCADKLAYWVSEKDGGIFNAMNKGIRRAIGEYLLFLNSGDILYDDLVLNKVFEKKLSQDIIYGNVQWEPAIRYNGIYPDTLTFEYFKTETIPHQGAFIRKDLFDKIGLYDEKHSIISDWLFFLIALYKFNCSYFHINLLISICNTEGLSFKPGSWDKIVEARKAATLENFSAFVKDFETFSAIRNELSLVKRTRGYRLHLMLRKLFASYFFLKK